MFLRNLGGNISELHGVTTQEMAIFRFTAVRKSNPVKSKRT
jgi:hypothetical protein